MKTKLVLDMRDRRPVWAVPDWVVEEVRRALPQGWTVEVVHALADGSGDGGASASSRALEAVADASVYLGFGVPAEILRAGANLLWVHSGAAGVGGSLSPEMKAWRGTFTNSAGVHGPPVAETVLAMILHFARGLDFAVRGQAGGRWWPAPFHEGDTPVREVEGATVGILGFGGMGREVARRVAPLGARVVGLRRRQPELDRDPETGAEILWGPQGLDRLVAESDYLVVTAPETTATRGLLSSELLARMKGSAVLVNVSRGKLVDEEALVAALEEGRLRGAALDVFHREPLPEESPLWGLANVLITPHVSAVSGSYWRRQADLITENIERFLAGRELVNVVNREAGY